MIGDIETFSRADLKKAGMAKYAEDSSTDILCFCYKLDDVTHAWIPSASESFIPKFIAFCKSQGFEVRGDVHVGPTVPADLYRHLSRGGEFHAWNAAFERSVLNGPAGRRYDFPKLEIKQMRCSMAKARVRGLPGALQDAADAVRAKVRKRISGQNAMRYLCKPRKDGSRPTIEEEEQRFLELVLYCIFDVDSEEAVDLVVPDMSDAEQEVYEIDQAMNDHGVLTDLQLVDNMEILIAQYKKELEKRCREMTGIKPSRAGPLAAWIRDHGFPGLENLQADTVRKVLLRADVPEDVKTVLKIYGTYNAKAVMKYAAIRKAACADSRIRHMFMFYGAGTGRWSSTIVQLQNLARPSIDDPETAIEASHQWDLDWIRLLYPGVDPMKVFGTCVRGALMAPEGKELVFPDFAGVEARWNAWMFDEKWKLSAYKAYDAGIGANLYCVVYGQCFGVDPESPEGLAGKQQGKVLDLSMGYEGGVGAFVKMAGTYRIDLRDMAEKTYPTLPRDVLEESVDAYHYAAEQGRLYELPEKVWITAEGLKRLWRRAHPRITSGWKDLKAAAHKAVENPGVVYKIPNGRIMFKVEGDWLAMRLPSGRKLYYYKPEMHYPRSTPNNSNPQPVLYYMGMNTVTRKWGRTSTYGGKVCENETQAGCRDLLTRAKRRLIVRAPGTLIGSVHDEPILETLPGQITDAEITEDMCDEQTWDEGLPLAVEIHRGKRYRK